MEMAKFLLGAIIVFTIVGGGYAEKVARYNRFIYIPTVDGGICNFKLTGYTFLPNIYGFIIISATTTSTTTCGLTTVFITD